MPQRAKARPVPHGGKHGVTMMLEAARASKLGQLARSQRVPKGHPGAARKAKAFKDGVEAELIEAKRERGEPVGLTAFEQSQLDAIHFLAAGLAMGYAWLGAQDDWIDPKSRSFCPVYEQLNRTHRMMAEVFQRLRLDGEPTRRGDLWALLYASGSQEQRQDAPDTPDAPIALPAVPTRPGAAQEPEQGTPTNDGGDA